jgi:hypothetical protein
VGFGPAPHQLPLQAARPPRPRNTAFGLLAVGQRQRIAALPFAASAETMGKTELDMFNGASLTIQQASDVALQAHPGTLAAVAFGDENGRAVFEAVVIGGDGQPWTVQIDAKTGEVFASGLSSAMCCSHEAAVFLVDALCAGAVCGLRHRHGIGGRLVLSLPVA